MATEANKPADEVSQRKLWFGLATSAFAWVSLGCLDIVVNWRACTHQEDWGIAGPHLGARVLIGALALAWLALAVGAGATSYRNWKRLSAQQPILTTQAVERREFMALLGVIISVTLGMGIVWLAIPPIFLDICWRAR
jgi:hypothetical protein